MLDTGRLPLTGDTLACFRQGLACAAAGESERAVANYNRVLQARPDYWEAWYERGLALEDLGFYAEAIVSYDRALEAQPRKSALVDILHDRGNALQYGLGNYQEAIDCYAQVLHLNPDHAMAWHNRGNALLYGLDLPAEAIGSYDRALQLNAQHSLTWRNRGNALVELKRYAEAIASYDRTLALDPEDQVALQARTLAAQQSGLTGLKQVTTKPAWYGHGFSDTVVVEREAIDKEIAEDSGPLEPQMAYLQPVLVIEDDEGQREVPLDQPRYTVGRDPKNDICLRSQFASRFHAVLFRMEQPDGSLAYRIVDGNLEGKPSTNGLLINGQKQPACELKTGDLIVFGPQVRATYRAPVRTLEDLDRSLEQ